MTSSEELWKAMKTALTSSGDLIHLKLMLEDSIMESIQQSSIPQFMSETLSSLPYRALKPAMPPEVILTNTLVCQYLRDAGLPQTASILANESGLPKNQVLQTFHQSQFPKLKCPKTKLFLSFMVDEYFRHAGGQDEEKR